jgi:tetratricopeptide (TPR) repeat protein
MKNNFKHSTSIEQFIANEMGPAEQLDFKKELKTNKDLAEELRLSQNIESALRREDIIELRQKLLAAINASKAIRAEAKVVEMRTSRKWWYAAASLLALCAISATLLWQTTRSVSADSLFSEYYNSENIIDQTRGDENIVEAVIKFQQKDFRTASELFKSILDKDNSNMAVWFYYGIANIETKNYENSIKAFNSIIAQDDNLYIEHAQWFLGLCYLKNDQNDKAIDQFAVVAADPDNFHRQEAKDILEKLQLK